MQILSLTVKYLFKKNWHTGKNFDDFFITASVLPRHPDLYQMKFKIINKEKVKLNIYIYVCVCVCVHIY